MKKTLVAIAALMLSASAFGQGAVLFANRLAGTFDAPVTVDNAAGVGAGERGAVAQLYIVNGTSLTAVGTPISYRGNSGALAKYFDGGQVDLPGTTVGGNVTLRVRSWVGASFAGALTRGESQDFVITGLGGGQLPGSTLDTMRGFFVTTIPEPTTVALGVLGAAALFAARRRK